MCFGRKINVSKDGLHWMLPWRPPGWPVLAWLKGKWANCCLIYVLLLPKAKNEEAGGLQGSIQWSPSYETLVFLLNPIIPRWTRTDPNGPGRTRTDPDWPGRTQKDPNVSQQIRWTQDSPKIHTSPEWLTIVQNKASNTLFWIIYHYRPLLSKAFWTVIISYH